MYGISATIIYADPDNAELWKKRPNPNQLMPGDEVSLGDPNRPSDLPTGAGHTLMISEGDDETLSIFLGSRTDSSFAGKNFELTVGDRKAQGTVPDDNVIAADIPLGSDSGELKVWLSDDPEVIASWTLKIGHLDPITEVTGVQARLNNLGYDAGNVDGSEDEDLDAAVAAFQDDVGLEPSGEIDDDVRAALDQAHDEQKYPPDEPEPADLDGETFEWEYSFAELLNDDDDDDGDVADDGDDDGTDDSGEPEADDTAPAAAPGADSGGGLWGEIEKLISGLFGGSGDDAGAASAAGTSSDPTEAETEEQEADDDSSETTTSEDEGEDDDEDEDDDETVDDDGYVQTTEEELADAGEDDDTSDDEAPDDEEAVT
jgi:N-acetylmuramoyl-L-alanine amidase